MGRSKVYRDTESAVRRKHGKSLRQYTLGRLAADGDLTIAMLAEELGVDRQRLHNWLHVFGYRTGRGPRLIPITTSADDPIAQADRLVEQARAEGRLPQREDQAA